MKINSPKSFQSPTQSSTPNLDAVLAGRHQNMDAAAMTAEEFIERAIKAEVQRDEVTALLKKARVFVFGHSSDRLRDDIDTLIEKVERDSLLVVAEARQAPQGEGPALGGESPTTKMNVGGLVAPEVGGLADDLLTDSSVNAGVNKNAPALDRVVHYLDTLVGMMDNQTLKDLDYGFTQSQVYTDLATFHSTSNGTSPDPELTARLANYLGCWEGLTDDRSMRELEFGFTNQDVRDALTELVKADAQGKDLLSGTIAPTKTVTRMDTSVRKSTELVRPGDKLLFLGDWRDVTSVARCRPPFSSKLVYTFEFSNYPPVTAHPGETFEAIPNRRER